MALEATQSSTNQTKLREEQNLFQNREAYEVVRGIEEFANQSNGENNPNNRAETQDMEMELSLWKTDLLENTYAVAPHNRGATNKFPRTYSIHNKVVCRFLHTDCPLSDSEVERSYKFEVELWLRTSNPAIRSNAHSYLRCLR